ncbi:hypothetical protein DIS24_g11476 [Lasiodiplodia hormozganensis]|uniref:Uncharacterized protein n=1 Tax=Lasiodiplodia hormozganensis TaxID=869390 RepID=A0AA39WTA7_9PEZI|nr:hypothetical protein DIS24_g11476 [Lasiodiplodia hormozganensis]
MNTTTAYELDHVEQGCRFLRDNNNTSQPEHLLRALSYCQNYAYQIIASHSQQKHQLGICYQSLASLQQQLEQERTEHASTHQQLEHERDEHCKTDSLLQEERLGHGAARAELSWQSERMLAVENHSANAHSALQECGKFADSLIQQLSIANGEEANYTADTGDPSFPRLADLLLELTSLRSTLHLLQENDTDGRLCHLLEENAQLRRRNGDLEKLVSAGSSEIREMSGQLERLNSRIESQGKPVSERRSRRAGKVKEEPRTPTVIDALPK